MGGRGCKTGFEGVLSEIGGRVQVAPTKDEGLRGGVGGTLTKTLEDHEPPLNTFWEKDQACNLFC